MSTALQWPAAILCLLLGIRASADVLPGAGSLAPGAQTGHAWVCIPARSDADSVAVLHLPPRTGGVPDGTVRLAARLPEAPERLAAWKNKLYLVFPPERAGSRPQRRVLVLSMEPGAIEGTWSVSGEGRRLPALPALPGDGDLLGFAATALGPVTLLGGTDGAGPRLLVAAASEWAALPLPTGVQVSERCALAPSPEGFALVDSLLGQLWVGELTLSQGRTAVQWRPRALVRAMATGEPAPPVEGVVAASAGGLLSWSRGGSPAVELWNATETSCFRLASIPSVGTRFAAAPLCTGDRVALVWVEEGPAAANKTPAAEGAVTPLTSRTSIIEVSAHTGEVLYKGPIRPDGPVSSQELKLLAVALVVVMAVVVVFVLRPGGDSAPVSLPKDIALAEPGRRLMAGLIDLAIAWIIAGRFTEFSAIDLISPSRLMTGSAPVSAALFIAGVGFLHGTLAEWLWGRTLGKAAVGCAVAWPGAITVEQTIEPVIRRPTLWRAAVRNLIKWVLPPVALSGVFAPDRRHRGDVIAGTVVVEHAGSEDAPDNGDAGPG
jgi:uncharacterized RDD family membrane protein YckC